MHIKIKTCVLDLKMCVCVSVCVSVGGCWWGGVDFHMTLTLWKCWVAADLRQSLLGGFSTTRPWTAPAGPLYMDTTLVYAPSHTGSLQLREESTDTSLHDTRTYSLWKRIQIHCKYLEMIFSVSLIWKCSNQCACVFICIHFKGYNSSKYTKKIVETHNWEAGWSFDRFFYIYLNWVSWQTILSQLETADLSVFVCRLRFQTVFAVGKTMIWCDSVSSG